MNRGIHWVGDLGLEAHVEIESQKGNLLVRAVEGGVSFTCSIDVSNGKATISTSSDTVQFEQQDGSPAAEDAEPTAQTQIKKPGRYRVRFANVDDQLYLWVNERPIKFDLPLTYRRTGKVRRDGARRTWATPSPWRLEHRL